MSNEENLKNNLTSDSLLESKVDILKCISSLSNDEVFTPPHLANEVLDLLPKEIWKDKTVTFLDPCCKTGVFLREITKRLIEGLEEEIPDLQERINHILTKQVFGLAITELTGLVSRRTVYCSKDANSKYSICTEFKGQGNEDVCYKIEDIEINQRYRAVEHNGQYYYYPQEHEGNILYPRTEHEWENGTCTKCGASQKVQDRGSELESHAYSFIHTDIKELFGDMKFDVIIGNPPYQLNDGGGTGSSARPIYHKFIEKAKQLNPRYITMIIPSRWFVGGKGLDEFRRTMLNDSRIKYLVDFPNAKECFPGNEIKGGVCYFLWDNNYKGDCEINTIEGSNVQTSKRPLLEKGMDTFIRDNNSISIFKKVHNFKEESFSNLVSNRRPFGLDSTYKGEFSKTNEKQILLYGNKSRTYISCNEILKNKELINCYNLLISKAIGSGNSKTDWIKPFISEPGSCCTETYLILYTSNNKNEVENVLSYTQTKFFHFLLSLKKITHNTTKSTYEFIPMQDFSKSWTDEELYEKYNLTDEEINHIESTIRPMGNKEG